MTYTKETVKEMLGKNPRWIERGLVVLHNLQTTDEQQEGGTIHHNNMGFNSSDSKYLSYCATWVKSGRPLNEKHLEKCGKKLPKYSRQILSLIGQK